MPIAIPNQFVDVDFDREADRLQVGTGNTGGGLMFGDTAPVFEDSIDVIPESQWRDEIAKLEASNTGAEQFVTRVYNQRQEGSCVSNATGQAHEVVQAIQYGKDRVVPLSAISLYKRCGRSPGSGSTVSGNLQELHNRGILPLDTPENKARFPHTMPNTGFSLPFPSGWEDTGKLFRGMEWFDIRSVPGLITALLKRWPVVVGRQGHSICYLRPQYRDGSLGVIYVNSWGSWGFGAGDHPSGFGFDSARLVGQSASWAFALRSVVVLDAPPAPVNP